MFSLATENKRSFGYRPPETAAKEKPFSGGNIDSIYSSKHNYKNIPLYAQRPALQAKLSVNRAGDKYELEANKIADKIAGTTSNIAGGSNAKGLSNGISPLVQTQGQDNGNISRQLSNKIAHKNGGGSNLDKQTGSFMSGRFGTDFSGVKVHTDSDAVQMNRELNAKAFTVGRDIYFNAGQYKPQFSSGKQLLAHELTHVVQQGNACVGPAIQKAMGDGHDLSSPRFAGNLKLEDAFDPGGTPIKSGDIGMHVRIIQQALVDAGEVLPSGVDGSFEGETVAAVKSFQGKQGLAGSDITGIVNDKTMELLDKFFRDHSLLAATPQNMVPSTAPTQGVEWATGTSPSELIKGTRTLKIWDKNEIKRRRTTEVMAPVGGTLPNFQMNIAGNPDSYEKRLEDATLTEVDDQFKDLGKDKAAAHADPTKLHSMSDIEKVGTISKREADRVFGNFAKGNPLTAGVNLKDAWDQKETEFAAGGAAYEQDSVEWRVNKIIQDPDITGVIDQQHGAVQSRSTLSPGQAKTEADIIKAVRNRIIASRRAELIETHKGWPGFADPPTRSVFIQRFKSATDSKNRDFMWDMFQTLIHEYIHTLAHSRYTTYANSLDEQKGGKTYREGMTDYFTKIVLESTVINDLLRTEVEGPFHDPLVIHPIPRYGGYGEAANAEAVAGVAGLRNVMAAFFLGKIELIGGS